jgi:hypothetical protein
MVVDETTLNEAAAIPPKLTLVVPVKLVPVIVRVVPEQAERGVNDEITGAVKFENPVKSVVPSGVVTDIAPDVPTGTKAVILVSETTVKEVAGVLPKVKEVAPVKFVPIKVTLVATFPVVNW